MSYQYQYQYQQHHYQYQQGQDRSSSRSSPLASTAKDFEWFTSRSPKRQNQRYSWLDQDQGEQEEEYQVPLKAAELGKPLMNFKLLDLTSWDDADADELLENLELPHQNSAGTAGTEGAVIDAEEVHFYKSFRAPGGAEAAWIQTPPLQDYEYRQGAPSYKEKEEEADDEEYCEYFDLTALSSEDITTSTVLTGTSASTSTMSMAGVAASYTKRRSTGGPLDADYYDLTGVEDEHLVYPLPNTIVDLTRNNGHPHHVDLTGFIPTTGNTPATNRDDDTGSVIYDLTYYESALESMSMRHSEDEMNDADDEDEEEEEEEDLFPTLHSKSTGTGVSSRSYDSCQSDQSSNYNFSPRNTRSASFHSITNNRSTGAAGISPTPSMHSTASVSTATRNVRWLEPLVQQVRNIDAAANSNNTSNKNNKDSSKTTAYSSTRIAHAAVPRNDSIPLEQITQEEETALLDMHVFSESRDEDDHVDQDRDRTTTKDEHLVANGKDIEIPFTSTNSTDTGISIGSSSRRRNNTRNKSPVPTTPNDVKPSSEQAKPSKRGNTVPPYYAATAFLTSMLGWNNSSTMAGRCPTTPPFQPTTSTEGNTADIDDDYDDDDNVVMIIDKPSPTPSELEEQEQREEDDFNAKQELLRKDETYEDKDDEGEDEDKEQLAAGISGSYSNDGRVQFIDEAPSTSNTGDKIDKLKEAMEELIHGEPGDNELQKSKSKEGKKKKNKKKSKKSKSKKSKKKGKKSSRKGSKKSNKKQEPSNLTVTWRRIKTKLTALPWKKKRNVALFTPSSTSEDASDQEQKQRRDQARMAIEKAAAETISNNTSKRTNDSEEKSEGLCRKSILNRRKNRHRKPTKRDLTKSSTEEDGDIVTAHYDGDADTNSEHETVHSKSTLKQLHVSEALNEIMPLAAILSGDFDDDEEEDATSLHRQNGAAAVAIAAASRESSKKSPTASPGQQDDSDDSEDVFFNLSPSNTMNDTKSILVRRGSDSQCRDDDEDDAAEEVGQLLIETSPGVFCYTDKKKSSVQGDDDGRDEPTDSEIKSTGPSAETTTSIVPLESSVHLLADTETSIEESCAGGKRDFWTLYSKTKDIKVPECPQAATECCDMWKSYASTTSETCKLKVSSSFRACWKPNLSSVDESTQQCSKDSLPPWARDDIFCKVPENLYSSDELDMNLTATADTQDGDPVSDDYGHFCASSPNVNSISNQSHHSCGIALQTQQSDAANEERLLQKYSRFNSIDHCYSGGNNSVASCDDTPFGFVGCNNLGVQESPSSECNGFEKSPLRDLCVDYNPHTVGSTWASKRKEVKNLKLDAADSPQDEKSKQSGATPNEQDEVENIASVSSEGSMSEDSDSEDEDETSEGDDNIDEPANGVKLATEDLLRALGAPRGVSRGDSPINEQTQQSCSIDSNASERKGQSGNLSQTSSMYTPEEQSSMEDIALSYSGDNLDTWSFEPQVAPDDDAERILQTAANLALTSQSKDDDNSEPIIPSDKPAKKPLSRFVKGILRGRSARKYSKKGKPATSNQGGKTQDNPTKVIPATTSSHVMEKPDSLKSIASQESHQISMSSLSVSTHGNKGKKKRSTKERGTKGSSLDRKRLEQLVSDLMAHPHGFIFSSPVDLDDFPDYKGIVKHPMDLGTILKKLLSSGYPTLLDFHADISLTFENAMMYNKKGSEVHKMATELKEVFEGHFLELLDELEANLVEREEKARLEV